MPLEVARKFKSQKRRLFFKLFFWGSFFIIAFAVASVYIVQQTFHVNKIEIAGNERVQTSDIQARVASLLENKPFFFWPEENILFLSPENIASGIKNQFSAIDRIKINRDFFNKDLRITIKEKDGWAVWCSEKCFYMDDGGIIFQPAPQFLGGLVFKITDKRAENFKLGDAVIKKDELDGLKSFMNDAERKNGFRIKTADIVLGPVFWLYADSGLKIALDSETDFKRAAENLTLFINSIPENKLKTADYVDLRFSDKIFYKSLPVF